MNSSQYEIPYSTAVDHQGFHLRTRRPEQYEITTYPSYPQILQTAVSGSSTDAGASLDLYATHDIVSSTAPLDYTQSTAYDQNYHYQWPSDARFVDPFVSQQFSDGLQIASLPATNEYFHPVAYSNSSHSTHSTHVSTPYVGHQVEPLPLVVSDGYSETYTTASLDLPSIPSTALLPQEFSPELIQTAYQDQYHGRTTHYVEDLHTSVYEALPVSAAPESLVSTIQPAVKTISPPPAELKIISRPSKSKDSNRQAPKKSSNQVAKQKKISIVKGDRGKSSRAQGCWRCRRYHKICVQSVGDCSSCITSGFRVWPSSLGCRRGQMTDFVTLIIPTNIDVLLNPQSTDPKPLSWRKASDIFDGHFGEIVVSKIDKWDQLMARVKAVKVLGPGIVELLQIAANYERRQPKQNLLLSLTARCLSTTIDIYHIFVARESGERYDPKLGAKELFIVLRQLLLSCVQRFLTSCLTGRLADWFPTFMAVNILGMVYILLGDTILVIPNNKSEIWPDIKKTITDLRFFHPITRDLLYVLAKGCDLLGMDFSQGDEALRLMDDNRATCQSMQELQTWRSNLMDLLNDDSWMKRAPFEVSLLPVMSLSRLFISQPQVKQNRPRITAATEG